MDDKRSKKAVTGSRMGMNEAQGAQTSANKQLKMEASIHSFIQQGLVDYLSKLRENPDMWIEWFEDLPGNVRGSLINQFVPKVKDVDATLKASMLSLTKSFEALPNIDNLTKRLHVLQTEVNRLTAKEKQNEMLYKVLLNRYNEYISTTFKEKLPQRNAMIREFMDYFYKCYDLLQKHYEEVIEQSRQMVMKKDEYQRRLEGVFDVTANILKKKGNSQFNE